MHAGEHPMEQAQQQAYAFVQGLINLVWLVMPVAGPFLTLVLVVRFLRWAFASARGSQDLDTVTEEMESAAAGFGNRRAFGTSYRPLRRMGYTDRELRTVRSRFRRW